MPGDFSLPIIPSPMLILRGSSLRELLPREMRGLGPVDTAVVTCRDNLP